MLDFADRVRAALAEHRHTFFEPLAGPDRLPAVKQP